VTRSGANRALVLGVLSLLFGLLGPFAIWSALAALGRIHAGPRLLPGRGRATLGLVCGIVSTLFMLAGIARFLVVGVAQ
jgi:hypothetical protein